MIPLSREVFEAAHERVSRHAYRTPLLTSRLLSERTGFDVRLKAEMFQRTGSYKIRGPLNKFTYLSDEQKRRGVICSSAGNHAQGVALAAKIHGIRAVVVMAENATPSKIAATRGYGAEVVLHGTIWDEANEKAKELVESEGLTYIHPFDDEELIAGQGTLGREIHQDWPEVEAAIVPIGGGGLISGVTMALKGMNPKIRVIGVESSGAPAMKRSVEEGTARHSRPGRLHHRRSSGEAGGRDHVRGGAPLRRRAGGASRRADLRGRGLDDVAREAGRGGSRGRTGRGAPSGARQASRGLEGRGGPERRQREPGSAPRVEVELT